ncbi:MAG TPA: acyl-CoA dehydrogenase family protein [Dehalococcoidia bacterium]|nr:acyl-CoA dehydrogenase family protein [Dehalococcoidia bacterium]
MSEYTEAQAAIQKVARDFARAEVAPGAAERDAESRFDYELYGRLGQMGFPGTMFPEQYGGAGADFLSFCLILEELGHFDVGLAWTLMVASMGVTSILSGGSEEQKERWRDELIRPVVEGRATSATASTEPDAGSDTKRMRTTAVRDGDDLVINGSKAFITNAGLDINLFSIVICRTEDGGFSTVIVPRDVPGMTVMPAYRKMGLHSSDTRELAFEDCRVPAFNALAAEADGRRRQVTEFFKARTLLASTAIGLHAECLTLAMDYAKQRPAFNQKLADFQYVQGHLVETALELELSRLMRDKTARLIDAGEPHGKEAAMTKWFCCEAAKRATDRCLQVFGGIGYMDEAPVSRYYRDIRAATIADGATEIQKYIVAREMGLFDA